jgi:hypothetical protein
MVGFTCTYVARGLSELKGWCVAIWPCRGFGRDSVGGGGLDSLGMFQCLKEGRGLVTIQQPKKI